MLLGSRTRALLAAFSSVSTGVLQQSSTAEREDCTLSVHAAVHCCSYWITGLLQVSIDTSSIWAKTAVDCKSQAVRRETGGAGEAKWGLGGQGEGAVRGVWRAREHQHLRAYNYKLQATLAGLELKLSIPLLADMPVARHCTNRCGGMLTLCNFNTC